MSEPTVDVLIDSDETWTTGPVVVASNQRAWVRFRRNKLAMASAAFIILLVIVAALGSVITPYDPAKQDILNSLVGPSGSHWLGTDEYGRDIFSRVLLGSRVSLVVGVLSYGSCRS